VVADFAQWVCIVEESRTMPSARQSNWIAQIPCCESSHLSYCFVNYSTDTLWLYRNELEGTIPSQVGTLTKLSKYKHDSLPWLSHLLIHFGVHWYPLCDSNGLTLIICAASLHLDVNKLTGTIPTEINKLVNLSEFVGHHVSLSFSSRTCPH
jgi:hypothetical protein